jgi:hypothetical protein
MLPVGLPNLRILPGQLRGPNDQQVLRVRLLRLFRKVDRAGNDRAVVDDYHLVVGNRVLGVDESWNPRIVEEGCRRILCRSLGTIEDNANLDAPLVGFQEGFGDRGRREREGLNEKFRLGSVDLLDQGVGAAAFGLKKSSI